jgi:hypothetical protein
MRKGTRKDTPERRSAVTTAFPSGLHGEFVSAYKALLYSVTNLYRTDKKSSQTLRQLLEQQAEVKVQLEELTCLVTMANQRLVRLEGSNDRVSTEDTQ